VVFLVLGNVADGGEKDWQASPMVVRPATATWDWATPCEFHVRSDVAERPDLDICAKFSTWIDHGGRMNVGHARNFEL
jgi:hypothetical protein